jgi:hypothetical protein
VVPESVKHIPGLGAKELEHLTQFIWTLVGGNHHIPRQEEEIEVRHKENTPESLEGLPIIELGVNVGDELCFH